MSSTPIRARQMNRLTARAVAGLSKPGRHADGGGLYLVVEPNGSKHWAFLFRWKANPARPGSGRLREMGLGSLQVVTLAEAREAALEARRMVFRRVDPIAERRQIRDVPTFETVCEEVIRLRASGLKSDKSLARWRRSLFDYASSLKDLPVDQITPDHVVTALRPIWLEKPESAQKARGYIEAVFDHAKAKRLRSGDNPAAWKGNLDQLLPARPRLTRGHHAALPFAEVPSFMQRLKLVEGVGPRALEFCILTAARTGEAREARWSEIDLKARIWTIPAERMKAGRIHRVPLTDQMISVIGKVAPLQRSDGYVFPGQKDGQPLSSMGMAMVVRRLEPGVTVHGFRSSFRDWAGETTAYAREVAEAALAHSVGDQTEAAYRRGDALEKRRALMADWARFCF